MKISKKHLIPAIALSVLFLGLIIIALPSENAKAATLLDQQYGLSGDNESVADVFNDTEDPRLIVARVLKIALEFVGLILLALIIYAGFKWMTSQGNEEKVTEAIALIRNALIGTLIIAAAWMITDYVTSCVLDITANTLSSWMCNYP